MDKNDIKPIDFNLTPIGEIDETDGDITSIAEEFNFDADAFTDDLDSLPENDNTINVYAKVKKSTRISKFDYKYARKLARDLGNLEEGESTSVVVAGSFIFGDFIEAYIITHNLAVTNMSISTLSYGQENIDSLKTLMELGYVQNLQLITSDYFFSHERRSGIEYTVKELGQHPFRLAAVRSHTKVTIFQTECGKHIVIQGSANLRSSGNYEQFTIDNNADLYKFYLQWHNSIFNDHQVKHKGLNHGI